MAVLGATVGAWPAAGQVNLDAGDIAVIGWCDNCPPQDVIAIVALADIPAGTMVYFTDNGWTGSMYRGASEDDGNGLETLLKFTATAFIPRGQIIDTKTLVGSNWEWTVSGVIGQTSNGTYSSLVLPQDSVDQVCAFQAPDESNPLLEASKHLFVFDDSGAFEPAVTASTGDVPPGLSVVAGTAVTLTKLSFQHVLTFKTDALKSGSKSEWLAAMANPANWSLENSGPMPRGMLVIDDDNPREDSCVADLTNDGVVDGADLGLLLSEWQNSTIGDLSGDGQTDGADLGLLLSAWGACPPG